MSDEQATTPPVQQVLLTSYQKKLIEQWKLTHGPDVPPPLRMNPNGTVTWITRKDRMALRAIERKKARKQS